MADGSKNVSGANMEEGRIHGAERRGQGQAEVRDHMANSASRGFYGAERAWDCFVMHGLPSLAILLVVNREGNRSGGHEDDEIRRVRKERLSGPEFYIADAELGCTGAHMGSRQGVFPHTEEEEKRQDYEVRDGL